MQNHLGIVGIATGIGGNQARQMCMQRIDNLVVHQLISRGGGKLFARDKFAQVNGVVLS